MEESIMVMEKSRAHLESLAKLAPQLNKATDLYMEELKEIEATLDKLNLGISVELDSYIQTGNSVTEYNDDTGESVGVFYAAWSLGYGKDRRGNWCLLIREYKVPVVPAGAYAASEDILEEDVTPLLQASRDLRIAAAEQIPELLKAIEQKVKKKIESLAKVSDKR